MKRTEDFFIPENKVKLEEELDYLRVDEYIRSAEAFSIENCKFANEMPQGMR